MKKNNMQTQKGSINYKLKCGLGRIRIPVQKNIADPLHGKSKLRQDYLYLRFILKVDQGSTLTLCPIMDILCRVGCRLNTTRSPSRICLST